MSNKDGGTKERERLVALAGVSDVVARTMSGADLLQKALSNASGTPVGPGFDGARAMLVAKGTGVIPGA